MAGTEDAASIRSVSVRQDDPSETGGVAAQPRISAQTLRQLRRLAAMCASASDLPAALDMLERGARHVLDPAVQLIDRPVLPPHAPGDGAVVSDVPQNWPGGASVDVPLGAFGGRETILRLPGQWAGPRERAVLKAFTALFKAALDAPAARSEALRASSLVASTYGFARRLAQVRFPTDLRHLIVETIATAVSAEQGSLATYEEPEGLLRIAATRGYPSVLVEHLRIVPGRGLLGQVYESARPMLVDDVMRLPSHTPRRRYRTSSFLAVPLIVHGSVIGVVSVTDRKDGRPFSRADLTAARALAAPAALALRGDRLAEQTRELSHAATVDPLTGLFNRRYFATRIEEEIERARRYSLELSLLLIDVDDFKRLNDELGHLAGDYLLRQISEVLKRSVRVFDVCTRFGGEEFAILMPGSGINNALVVAERIRARVEQASREAGPLPPHLRITVSLGLAGLASDPSPLEFIARADRALYRAKGDGKNCVRVEG
jgi:diguanylate cyclase (GGDEF)-like protein